MCVNLLVIIAVRFSPTAASVAFLRPVSTEVTTGLIEGAPLTPSVVAFPTFRSAFEVAFTFGGMYLKDFAKIDRDVVITGNNDRAQIWSADNWKAKTRQQLNPETISALLEGLGI